MSSEILQWDSQFFGWTVARLTDPKVPVDRLSAMLFKLKAQSVRLFCWARTEALPPSDARALGARLVDKKPPSPWIFGLVLRSRWPMCKG
jgi:hypothetical protein